VFPFGIHKFGGVGNFSSSLTLVLARFCRSPAVGTPRLSSQVLYRLWVGGAIQIHAFPAFPCCCPGIQSTPGLSGSCEGGEPGLIGTPRVSVVVAGQRPPFFHRMFCTKTVGALLCGRNRGGTGQKNPLPFHLKEKTFLAVLVWVKFCCVIGPVDDRWSVLFSQGFRHGFVGAHRGP